MKSKSASSQVTMNRELNTPIAKAESPAPVIDDPQATIAPIVEARAETPQEPELATPQLQLPSQWPKPTAGTLDLPILEELDCEACQ